jgi:hypothetical protein
MHDMPVQTSLEPQPTIQAAQHALEGCPEGKRVERLLGIPGYCSRLTRLEGPTAVYNGFLARPKRHFQIEPDDRNTSFVVSIPTSEMAVELVLPSKYFKEVLVDLQYYEDRKCQLKGPGVNQLQQAGTLKTKISTFSAALRARCKGSEQAVRDLFSEFDTNNDGNIDKVELLLGLRDLGVMITEDDVEAIWPVLDQDDDGEDKNVVKSAVTQSWPLLMLFACMYYNRRHFNRGTAPFFSNSRS